MIRMHHRSGVLLLDILIGIGVFSIIVGFITSTLLFSLRSVTGSGDRVRAIYITKRGIEAARSVRDDNFANLVPGIYGQRIQSGLWTLSGTGVTTDGFTTQVTISNISTDHMLISAKTTWNFGKTRSGSVVVSTELTNWRKLTPIGNWSSVALDGSFIDAGTPLFNTAVDNDSYLFVGSEVSDGGDGLYVFDISDTTNPTRVATSFSISDVVHDLLLVGNYLYVVQGNNSEVQIYDVTSPTTLSAADIVETVNVSGNSAARSIDILGNTLFVVTTGGGGASEISSFDVTDINNVTAIDTYDDTGEYHWIKTVDNYAYISSGLDASELRIISVINPADLKLASVPGANLADTPDALSIAGYNKYVLLGRLSGAATEEIILYDIQTKPLTTAIGPWFLEAGGTANSVDMDPGETYGFVASDLASKELRVLNIADFAAGSPPEIAFYDTATGEGRGVYYSWRHDRVFLLTNTAVVVIKPGS